MPRSSNSAISPISCWGRRPVARLGCRAGAQDFVSRHCVDDGLPGRRRRGRRSGAGSRARCGWADLGSNWLMNHIRRCANDSGSGPGAGRLPITRTSAAECPATAAMSSRTPGASNTSRRVTSTPARRRGRATLVADNEFPPASKNDVDTDTSSVPQHRGCRRRPRRRLVPLTSVERRTPYRDDRFGSARLSSLPIGVSGNRRGP